MYHWSLSLAKGCHPHPASLPGDMSETNLVSHKGRSLGISKFPTWPLGCRKGKEGEEKRFHGTSRSQRSEDGSSSSGLSIKTCKNKKDVSLVPAEGK